MIACLRLFLLLTLFCLISVVISSSETIPSKTTLGIAPDDEKYFKSEVIKCKDGSKKVPKEKFNDDFCDCADGTDEPGTSACPEGKFYCRNSGHIPLTLFSSRVNDGICDCCDGSDEYDGKVNCSNTCWEAGKVAREKLKKKIATYQDGAAIRKNEVEQAKEAIRKDEAELTKLKNEEKILKGLVQQLKARKEQIEKAEELERKEKEKEKEKEEKQKEAERKDNEVEKQTAIPNEEVENVAEAETEFHDQHAVEESGDDEVDSEHQNNEDKSKYDASPAYEVAEQKAEHLEETVVGKESNDNKIESSSSYKETQEKEGEVSEDTEGLSKEELGRFVASRWTGEKVQDKPNEVDHNVKEKEGEDEAIPESSYDGYSSEAEESGRKYGDEDDTNVDDEYEEEDEDPLASYKPDEEDHDTDFSDVTTSSSSSWLERIQETVRNMIQQFNFFRTPVDKSEAENVRKEYDDSSSKLSQIQSRISSLTKKLSYDFGPEKEFYSFYNHCFESKQNKYVYKVCPFKEASQVEGHSTTRLGRWDKFEDSYRVMQFSSGDKCWNGPDRSLKVKLRCGLKNELTDVDEPSRCEYIALLSTPAVCVQERLKELQHKLDMLLQEQPPKHDEL